MHNLGQRSSAQHRRWAKRSGPNPVSAVCLKGAHPWCQPSHFFISRDPHQSPNLLLAFAFSLLSHCSSRPASSPAVIRGAGDSGYPA